MAVSEHLDIQTTGDVPIDSGTTQNTERPSGLPPAPEKETYLARDQRFSGDFFEAVAAVASYLPAREDGSPTNKFSVEINPKSRVRFEVPAFTEFIKGTLNVEIRTEFSGGKERVVAGAIFNERTIVSFQNGPQVADLDDPAAVVQQVALGVFVQELLEKDHPQLFQKPVASD